MNERLDTRFEHPNWIVTPEGSIRGQPFRGMALLAPEAALKEAASALAGGRFADCMREWNGSFSIVVERDGLVGLAVDRARTMPVFYAMRDGRLIASDNAEWIRQQLGNPPLDPVRKAEFMLAGLVLNDGTLCRDIHQVQSGEAIVAQRPDGASDWDLQAVRYRVFRPDGSGTGDYEEWLKEYDRVLTNCFERAVKVIRGRPVLVPLSGGYDSRLLLLMLMRLGVKDISTYTYGRKITETGRSREVATALGVPWRLCDYSHVAWRQAAVRHNVWEHMRRATNLASMAIPQEWLAIHEHIDQGLAGSETVVMTGYSADFPAGSFYTSFGERGRAALCSRQALEKILWRNRLGNWRTDAFPKEVLEGVSHELIVSMGEAGGPAGWLGAFETWTHSEWVSKAIANAIRAADFSGCDWCLPFFDDEFLAFWERAPAQFRIGEQLHCDFTDRLYRTMARAEPPARHKSDKYGIPKPQTVWMPARKMAMEALTRLYNSPIGRPLRERRQRKHAKAAYRNHPLGASALLAESEFIAIAARGQAYNSWRTVKYLEMVE